MELSEITDIATSGMRAQRTRLAVTATNIANAQTTRSESGGAYRRRDPVFEASRIASPFASALERKLRGVSVSRIAEDPRDLVTRYMPGHPDADENGIVEFPNVNLVEEQANLVGASRAFEANVFVMRKARAMSEALMQVGRG